MMEVSQGYRPIRTGYSLSLIAALAAQMPVYIALRAAIYQARGESPLLALDTLANVIFITSFGQLFAARLIFWNKSSPATQSFVRRSLTAALTLEVVAWLSAVIVVLHTSVTTRSDLFVTLVTIAATVFQPGTVIWLLRYRRD